MKDPRFVAPFLTRGSIWLFFRVQFAGGQETPKYCVVMENAEAGSILDQETVIVVLATSRLDYSDLPWTVKVPAGTVQGLKRDSLVDLNNYRKVKAEQFCRPDRCKYVGNLPDDFMAQIDEALEYATALPPEIIIRVRPL